MTRSWPAVLVAALSLAFVPAAADVTPTNADSGLSWTLGGEPCTLIAPLDLDAPAPRAGLTDPLDTPIETGPCPGVRPGALVVIGNQGCTLNFLFNGYRTVNGLRTYVGRYIGTAGHCVVTAEVEKEWAPGTGPVARDAANNRIGEVAYATLKDPRDFALIRLDEGVKAFAQVCHWGGPTKLNRDIVKAPVVLRHTGRGVGFGDTAPGRTMIAGSMAHSDHVYGTGAATTGDSGSPVITERGEAVGVLVTGGLHHSVQTDALDLGAVGITRLGPQRDRAMAVLGLSDLELQTAVTTSED